MTPIDELRAAAKELRTQPSLLPVVAGPLAKLLDLEADVKAARATDFPGGVWALDPSGDLALAIARAINNPASCDQHREGEAA